MHDLRQKSGSDISLKHAQALLGHSDPRITERIHHVLADPVKPTRWSIRSSGHRRTKLGLEPGFRRFGEGQSAKPLAGGAHRRWMNPNTFLRNPS